MDVVVRRGDLTTRPVGAIAVGILEGERRLSGAASAVDRASGGAISALIRAGDFAGRLLETAVLYPRGIRARRLVLVGLGPGRDLSEHRVRLAAGQVIRRARDLGAGTVATVVHGAGRGRLDPELAAQAVVEGSVLGHHRFAAYRRDQGAAPLRRLELVESDAASARLMKPAAERGARWAEAVCLARELVHTPGQDLTPAALGQRAREIARRTGSTARVFAGAELARLKMGALIAVGRGSVNAPRFIVLERGASARARERRTVVVIGKGITFDTGGISLKPRENMAKMKYDMAGAAAVLGLFSALPTVAHPFRVIGLIPTAENMPGGRALKPGDVVRALDGTTIEVTNTDAEGRLVLADALGYAHRYEPEAVIDLATLTGAISIALGYLAAGLFTADDTLAAELLDASYASGERLWRMPLWDEYAAEMRSDTADLVNSTGMREGGAVLAAAFLKRFARDLRWAHLDIAGTAWSPSERPHEPRGPTGFGVRLLLEWISRRADAGGASLPAPRARP